MISLAHYQSRAPFYTARSRDLAPVEGNDAICFDSSLPTNLRLMLAGTAAGARSTTVQAGGKQRLPRKGERPMVRTSFQKVLETITRKALPCFLTSTILLMVLPVFAADKQKDEDTLRQANLVLQGLLNSKSISPTLLAKANCVLILPGVKKFGFGVGGSGGRGPLLCRSGQDFKGKWSAPAMYSVGGASVGLQVGGSSSDFVLLLMNSKVVNQVLNGKTKMGTDATAAAGPGATAASASDADILTYGRA